MARFVQKTATILAGQTLSSVIDCSTGAPAMIFVPADWTPSHLSFEFSPDGTSFYAGVAAFNVVDGTAVILPSGLWPVTFLRLRSGLPQEADRLLTLTLDTRRNEPH